MARDPNRRETIISGAIQLFLLRGYDGVTIDEICSFTNSAKGSFYHVFSSKEDLAVQLIDEVWHETQTRMAETFAKDTPPLTRIKDELTYSYTHTHILAGRSKQFTGCPIGTLSVSLAGKSSKIRKRINFALNHMRHFYVQAFTDAVENGDINSELEADQLADLLLVTIQGIGIISRCYNSQAKIRKLVNNIMPVFTG
jgi:TetR/AcrR family transcriptional repressor of nem operon